MTANSISLETEREKYFSERHANVPEQEQVRPANGEVQRPRVLLVGPLHPAESGIAGFQRQAVGALAAYADVSVVDVAWGGVPAANPFFDVPHFGTLDLRRPRSWKRVVEALADEAFDLVCVTVWVPFALPAYRTLLRALKKRGVRTASLVHSYVPRRMRWALQAATRRLVELTDDVVALEGAAEHMVPERASWILHPVYTHHGEVVDREAACRALGLDPAQRHLLFFGYGRSYKGLDLLLHAVAALDERVVLLVVGKQLHRSPRLDAAFRLVSRLVAAGYIKIVDEVVPDATVPLYFSAADAVLLPYRRPTSSGVGQMAVHFGRPLVVSNFPALTYLATFHPASRVAYPGDLASLIEAIRQSLAATDASDAAAPAQPLYSWDDFALDFLACVSAPHPEMA